MNVDIETSTRALGLAVGLLAACSFDSQPAPVNTPGSIDASDSGGSAGLSDVPDKLAGAASREHPAGSELDDAGMARAPSAASNAKDTPDPAGAKYGAGEPRGDAAPGSGPCNLPACVRDLISRCEPSGACTTELDGLNVDFCYANGIKARIETMLDGTRVRSVATWTRSDGRVCYGSDIEFDAASDRQTTQSLRDPSGALVATSIVDREAGTWTVTCKGGRPIVVNVDACADDAPLMADGSDEGEGCELGSCD